MSALHRAMKMNFSTAVRKVESSSPCKGIVDASSITVKRLPGLAVVFEFSIQ